MIATYMQAASREDRVRAQTDPEINRRLDQELERRIRFYATQDKQAISERLRELDQEWDIERALQTNAASITLATMLLGAVRSRIWFLVPIVVSGFLLQQAIQGWCPPVSIFRRRGMRTRQEIEQERYALKTLRGDFGVQELKKGKALRKTQKVVQSARQRVPASA